MLLNIPDIVWSIINFLVMVAILNKFLYKPVLGMLETRKSELQSQYKKAEEVRTEALQMREAYLQEMQNARQEAREIIAKASQLAEVAKEEILAEAQESVAKLSIRAKEELRLEEERAKAELREEVLVLAVLAAGKILEKAIQPEDHAKLIRELVSEVGGVS